MRLAVVRTARDAENAIGTRDVAILSSVKGPLSIPSLPLTTTFPLWKTALRLEVTLPSPTKLSLQWDLGSSELVGASIVRSGIWGGSSLWKTVLRPEDTL
jgi:hypothetical protein